MVYIKFVIFNKTEFVVLRMKEHRSITVRGNIEKIDFLYYTEVFAIRHNLNGFVKNGQVDQLYLEAEGEKAELNELERYLAVSPLSKYIDNIDVKVGEMKYFDDFRVIHKIRATKPKATIAGKLLIYINNLFS